MCLRASSTRMNHAILRAILLVWHLLSQFTAVVLILNKKRLALAWTKVLSSKHIGM